MSQAKDDISLKTPQDIFDRLKSSVLNVDPVYFCEENLILDGRPFRLRGNGYKPFVEIYRYIGIQALTKNSKPVVLVKGRQVGATTMGVNLELFFMGCGMFGVNNRAPMRVMHLYPQLDMAKAYTKTKLNPAISQSRQVIGKNNKSKGIMETMLGSNAGGDSLEFKEFQNGNYIRVDSVGIDADRIRGGTVDCMFFDEVQDMFKRAILNATQLLRKSQYGPVGKGIQIYMGTPKSKDSVYYDIWTSSTQKYYFLGCESCNEYFPLYTPGSDEWEKIWLEGFYKTCDHCDKKFDEEIHFGFQVKCTHCGHIQDKREAAERGKWIGKDPENCEYEGFHINVLYMPEVDRKSLMSQKPGISATVDETTWLNEVLGEFYSGGGIVITAEEIKAKCADFGRKCRKIILPEECTNDRNVYMGCDWGKKIDTGQISKGEKKLAGPQGQSYSCIVIIQSEGPQVFSIQHAFKLPSNDLSYKMELLDQTMVNYNVKLAVGDIGFAYDLMRDLQHKFGSKFLASEASGSQIHGKVKFNEDEFPQTVRFEKDYYIERVFNLLRAGAIRFPFGSWELIAWLVQHCTNMVAKPQIDKFGNVKVKYAKGSIANDGLMALINAYLAYEFDITNGYKTLRNIAASKEQSAGRASAIGVYLPKMKLTM